MTRTGFSFWKKAVAVATVLLVGMGGGVALASHTFNDVSTSNGFHDDIDFIASRAITVGCGGGNYCPSAPVTRGQMAAFLERTARVLSPVVLGDTDLGLTQGVEGCIVGPISVDFESVAVLSGGLYSEGSSNVYGRARYRENGGTWRDTSAALNIADHADASGYGSAPIDGFRMLEPGNSYEFGVRPNRVSGNDNGCNLVVTISHQMPADALAAAFLAEAGDEQNLGE